VLVRISIRTVLAALSYRPCFWSSGVRLLCDWLTSQRSVSAPLYINTR